MSIPRETGNRTVRATIPAGRNGAAGRTGDTRGVVLRRAMARFLCGAAVLGAVSAPACAADAPQKGTFRLLSLNTWGDRFRNDMDNTSIFFGQGNYDVVGFQELRSGSAYVTDLPAMLDRMALGTYSTSQRGDVGVISRLSGTGGTVSATGGAYSANVGYITLDAQNGLAKTIVGSVHLNYYDETSIRVEQAKSLNAWAASSVDPVFLVGDFNAGDVSERGLHSAEQQSYLFARVIVDGGSSQLWRDLAQQYTPDGREAEFQAYVADMQSSVGGTQKYRKVISDYFDAHRADYPGISSISQMSWRQWEEIIAKDMADKGLTFEDETHAVDGNLPLTMNVLKKNYILLQNESERELFEPIDAGDGRTTWTSKGEDQTNTWTSWDHVKIDHFVASRPFGKWFTLADDPADTYTGVLTRTAFANDGTPMSDHEAVAHTVRWVGPVLQDFAADGSTKRLVWGAAANTFDEAGGVFHLSRNNNRTDVYLGQIADENGNPILAGLSEAEKKTLLDCHGTDGRLQAAIREYCIDDHSFIGETLVMDGGTIVVDEDAALGLSSAALRLANGGLRIDGTAMAALDRQVKLDGLGWLDVNEAAATVELRQAVSGAGALVKRGAGTLQLAAANSHTGGTIVEAGTLSATVAGAFTHNTAYAVNGGTLDLGGFDLTASQLSGTGGAIALGGADLAVDQSTNTRFDGVIAGTGGLTKSGAGALVLNGRNTYTGTTRVEGGWLVVGDADHTTASLAGTVSLGSGGHVGGAGSLGTLALDNGAVLAPGNSIGTLAVTGDLSFSSGSTYQVEIDAGGAGDRVDVGGTATLNGATVDVNKAAGNYGVGQRYTILTATGGVSGTFGALTQNLPFLDLLLAYDPTAVHLDVLRNATQFESVAETGNQRATAHAVEALGVGNAVYNAVARQASDAAARASFDALSGEIHASVGTVLANESGLLRDAANARVRALFGDGGSDGVLVSTNGPAREETVSRAIWGAALGGWAETDGNGNASKLQQSTGGLVIGLDGTIGDAWQVGVMAGFTRTAFDVKGNSSSGTAETAHVGVYGGTRLGNVALKAGATHSWHTLETTRHVAAPGLAETLSADYDARTLQAFGEVSYLARFQAATLEPFANLAYVLTDTDSFAETGGAAALSGKGESQGTAYTTLGLRAEAPFELGSARLKARGTVGWQHAYGDVTPASTMSFAGGAAFEVSGAPIARDTGLVEAGLEAALGGRATAGLAYSGAFGDGLSRSQVKARLSLRF